MTTRLTRSAFTGAGIWLLVPCLGWGQEAALAWGACAIMGAIAVPRGWTVVRGCLLALGFAALLRPLGIAPSGRVLLACVALAVACVLPAQADKAE